MNHICAFSNDFSLLNVPSRKRSALATWAVNSGSVVHSDFFQRRPALFAGLSAATVDQQRLGKVAGLAVAVHKVPQGGSAHQDSGTERFPDSFGQPVIAVEADSSCFSAGMDAGFEQGFIGVDVACANHDLIIHDERLHWRVLAAGEAEQVRTIEFGSQGFGAEMADQRVLFGRVGPEPAAKPSGSLNRRITPDCNARSI